MEKTIKVVHLPTDIGMRAYSLSKAERELGLESWVIVRRPGPHSSDSIKPLCSPNPFIYSWRLLKSFIKTLNVDVIMANSGSSLLDFGKFHLPLLDIPLYKKLGKRVIVTYQGCDIRLCELCPVRISLPAHEICPIVMNSYKEYDRIKLKRFKIWLQYADYIFGITPDLCHLEGILYTPHAKYIETSSIISNAVAKDAKQKVRIAYFARKKIMERIRNIEFLKGTQYIEETLEKLILDFPNKFECVPIADLPWDHALKLLYTCDILVDQIVFGWYGGMSVEAALLGVIPVAYIDSKLLSFIPEDMRNDLPVLALESKEHLYPVLQKLIFNREIIIEESIRCRKSAMKFHEARVVASKMIKDYYKK